MNLELSRRFFPKLKGAAAKDYFYLLSMHPGGPGYVHEMVHKLVSDARSFCCSSHGLTAQLIKNILLAQTPRTLLEL